MSDREKLARSLGDQDLVRYFSLDKTGAEVLADLDHLELTIKDSQDEVPFNAQVKGYAAAQDQWGDPWIVKVVQSNEEMMAQRACMVAYVLDHITGTMAAPTTAVKIGNKRFRATKVVKKAVQISSYNYLEQPFIDWLRADLINRWIYFDEDRNPNNYLVITNTKNQPFMVAIDYDKADLLSPAMKITGAAEKFGWLRAEKTRFLTLLRPEHFAGLSISAFDDRLKAYQSISKEELLTVTRQAFRGYFDDADHWATQVADNLQRRIEYVDQYFRKMFKETVETASQSDTTDYSMMGASFIAMHDKKK